MADKQIQDALNATDEQFKSQNSQFLMEQSATFFIETVLENMNEGDYDKEAEKQRILEKVKGYNVLIEDGKEKAEEWEAVKAKIEAENKAEAMQKGFKKEDLVQAVKDTQK